MKKLSTGDDATLGSHRKLAAIAFGEDSKAVKFLDKMIADSPNGAAEEAIADEGQMIYVLARIHAGKTLEAT